MAIADALHHNSTLQSLNLTQNHIGDEGLKSMTEALKYNKSLQELAIST